MDPIPKPEIVKSSFFKQKRASDYKRTLAPIPETKSTHPKDVKIKGYSQRNFCGI